MNQFQTRSRLHPQSQFPTVIDSIADIPPDNSFVDEISITDNLSDHSALTVLQVNRYFRDSHSL